MNEMQQNSYETGSTKPPKSHSGLIAILLAAVILLCGITTALGLMNIRLTLALQDQNANRYGAQFDPASSPSGETLSEGDQDAQPALGIRGNALSELAQRFYHLPPGFWIQDVIPNSPAYDAGVQQGDILLAINGIPVASPDGIRALLRQYAPGDTINILLFRGDQRLTLSLTLAESA